MSDKVKEKVVGFLKEGFRPDRGEDGTAQPEETEEGSAGFEETAEEECPEDTGYTADLMSEISQLKEAVAGLEEKLDSMPRQDLGGYMSTKEQFKAVTHAIETRDISNTNKTLIRALEQISVMREDFFKLCGSMRSHLDDMSAEDVLSSFEAYQVDMENILIDAGVSIGPFPYEKPNTLHQRIIDIVPTDDPELHEQIAARHTDGYKIGDKVLLKEKVSIYKFTETEKAETSSEADDQTVSETDSEDEKKVSKEEEE